MHAQRHAPHRPRVCEGVEQGQNSRVGAAVGADARAAAAVVSRDNLGGHRGRDKAGANIDGLGVNPSDARAAAAV